MSVEKLELDYIETPDDSVTFAEAQQDVVVDTKKNLDDLRNDIQHPEIYGTSDEQYYFLGQTNVKDGDIRDVTDAIEFRDKLSDAKITISGGADQLFMSEVKGQQVLDGEIAKLQTLKASFSGANVAMIEQLIAELTNSTNHKNIAARYPRADKRSNLGNARLIAARIASGYTEVLTTIATKIKETGHDTTFSYDIPWELCVIGTSGDKLFDRKINVHITITSDAVPVNDGPKPTDKPPVNPSDQPPTPTDEEPSKTDEEPSKTDEEPSKTDEEPSKTDEEPTPTDEEDPTNVDVVDAVPLVIVHSMIADVLNPKDKVVFWDSTYIYDHTTRSKLPNGDMVVSIKDKASGKVVLDVGYTKDGVPYIGLDGYKHIVATDATQASIDGFVDFVAIHMMAADTPKFELLLSKVTDGKNAQNPTPSIEEPIQQDDGELEIEGSNKFTEAFSLSAVEINNQKTESGKLLTLLPGTNTDFLSAAAKPTLFTKDAKGNYFPNIEAIQEYYDDNGLQVEFIMAGPTYEDGTTITGLAKDIYTDKDGKQKISHVGSSIDFSGKAASMGLLLIEDGKMSLHHTLDKPTPTIPKDAEAITLSSVKRPDPDKPGSYKILTSNVEKYKYGHRIVEDKNGNISILMLKDMSNEDKIALVNDDTYKRILYCDVLGNNAHLDAYWSRDDDAMTYSYHGAADVLWDGTGGASEVRGNMPGLLVVSVPKKKNTPTPVINTIQNIGPTVIPPKEEPISIQAKGASQIDGVVSPSPNLTKIPSTPIDFSIGSVDEDLEEPVSVQPKTIDHLDGTTSPSPTLTKVPSVPIDFSVNNGGEDDKPTRNIDSPFVYGSKEWLASKLVGKLEGISLTQFNDYIEGKSLSIAYNNPYNKEPFTIKSTISGIDNPVLRDEVLSYIDRGDIRGMYENIYGMHDNNAINPYLHYRPIDKITPMMMHAMSLRLWHTHDVVANKEQLDRIKMPDDVREVWKDYKRLKLHLLSEKNGPNNFAIVSKTDFKMYLFLPDGTLVGTQNILVGKNPSDTQRLVSNTPSGKYKTNGFFNKSSFNAKYYDKGLGNFIKLWSLEDKFKNVQRNDAGIGIHELYDPTNRASALLDDVTKGSGVRNRKRVSDGCINASNSPLDFGSIFTHLVPKSDVATCVYVTEIPNESAVYNYYAMLQQQAPIVMK